MYFFKFSKMKNPDETSTFNLTYFTCAQDRCQRCLRG